MKLDRKIACYEDLKRRILVLDIAPGVLLDETAVSKFYDLSRTPVREIFQRLAFEGYFQIQSNRGTNVSSMDLNVMRNFFQTAPVIYATVARLAAENATASEIEALKEVQKRFLDAVECDRAADMVIHNHRFHELIGEMSDSVYLSPSLNRLLIDHTRMSQRFYRPRQKNSRDRIAKAGRQHDAMIQAIEDRDSEQIARITMQHWELSRGHIEKYIHPDPLPVDTEPSEPH